jgi:AbrB family looped-hinge helix DNA binding protein
MGDGIYEAIMTCELAPDKAGRVVLPKSLRDQMRLAPGDTLTAEIEGDRITLQPLRQRGSMRKV